MAEPKDHESHRWVTRQEADIDAYRLVEGNWMLYAQIKDVGLAYDDDHWRRAALGFPLGPVLCVARALKTPAVSEPLPALPIAGPAAPAEVWAVEAGLRYRLETEKVLNPGLFLDQRLNRARLSQLVAKSPDGALLNLFSYTGSFTMAALRAGARSTTSVDASARYLAWEKRNFEENFRDVAGVSHRLIRDDARDFLRRAAKKGTRYAWIIVDPPTFSRGEGKPFRVHRDLMPMLRDAIECLAPGGHILASINDAGWPGEDFYDELDRLARENGLTLRQAPVSDEFGSAYPLKCAWLEA